MEKNYRMPFIAKSKTNTKHNLVGSWRMGLLPFFTPQKISPCEKACPLNQEIPEILELTKKQKYEEAWRLIVQKNPFPSVCGRICKHFCKDACNRQYYDGSVNFKEIERFLGDLALKNNWSADFSIPSALYKVAVIGAGPAGIAAAYFLTKKGVSVEIFEKENNIGGMPKFIPSFRLPKTVFYGEIEQNVLYKNPYLKIFSKIDLHKMFVKNVLKNNFYQALIIATGNNLTNELNIRTVKSSKIICALDFLKKPDCREASLKIHKKHNYSKIVIIGGGNTAVDAARAARRLYDNARIIVIMREDEKNIPAHKEEIEFAAKEKIEIRCSAAPMEIMEKEKLLIEFDEVETAVSQNGELIFKPKNNKFHETADLVITALGFNSYIPFLNRVSEEQKNKIFIAGDAASREKSLPHAVASAKIVAHEALNFLETGKRETVEKDILEVASMNDINTAYFPKKFPFIVNAKNFYSCEEKFEELTETWEEYIVKEEANRCFYCGACLKCDNCFEFCPDLAITKTEELYEIKKDYCKGCLICVKECPRGLIKH